MIKIGIIGCGKITEVRHAPEYAENPNCRIDAWYDAIPGRAEALAEKFGGKVCQSAEELIAGDLDAVSLRQPFIAQLHEALGDRYVLFEEHGLYGKTMNLCVAQDDTLDSEVKERLVRSFIAAEQQAISVDIDQTNAEVASALRIAPSELCDCMFVEGAVGLRQSLILTLEDQARWVRDSGLVEAPVEFDSLDMLDPGPLDAVESDRVTILR